MMVCNTIASFLLRMMHFPLFNFCFHYSSLFSTVIIFGADSINNFLVGKTKCECAPAIDSKQQTNPLIEISFDVRLKTHSIQIEATDWDSFKTTKKESQNYVHTTRIWKQFFFSNASKYTQNKKIDVHINYCSISTSNILFCGVMRLFLTLSDFILWSWALSFKCIF